MKNVVGLYQSLLQDFGDSVFYWPQWCASEKSIEEREKIIIGMILVQKTSWHNANIALKNLREAKLLSIKDIANLKSLEELTSLIRPAGFFQSKPQRLFDLCSFIVSAGGVDQLMQCDIADTRSNLLNLKGVGPETADTILLYALDKPAFVIDEYTRRWSAKEGLTDEKDYHKLQQYFLENLPEDIILYRNLHTLIIVSQRGKDRSVMEVV